MCSKVDVVKCSNVFCRFHLGNAPENLNNDDMKTEEVTEYTDMHNGHKFVYSLTCSGCNSRTQLVCHLCNSVFRNKRYLRQHVTKTKNHAINLANLGIVPRVDSFDGQFPHDDDVDVADVFNDEFQEDNESIAIDNENGGVINGNNGVVENFCLDGDAGVVNGHLLFGLEDNDDSALADEDDNDDFLMNSPLKRAHDRRKTLTTLRT